MKKKVLALSFVMALLAIAVVGGSLAWFTDTDEVKNTFVMGTLDIKQKENYYQNSALMPIVHNNTETLTDDANYVKKEVWVENYGNAPAYVRTHIAVPTALVGVLQLDLNTDASPWEFTFSNTATIGGKGYTVYSFTYGGDEGKELEGTTNWILAKATEKLLLGVYIDEKTNLNVYRNDPTDEDKVTAAYFVKADGTEVTGFNLVNDEVNVYVATQAVQADGFKDTDDDDNDAKEAFTSAFNDELPEFTA